MFSISPRIYFTFLISFFEFVGDWFYHFVELLSMAAVCLAIYGVFGPLMATYDERFDKFGSLHIPSEFGIAYVVGPATLLAIIFHPSLNKEFFSDTCWTISMYVEAAAMLPQLYMFQKQASDEGGSVEPLTGGSILFLSFSYYFLHFYSHLLLAPALSSLSLISMYLFLDPIRFPCSLYLYLSLVAIILSCPPSLYLAHLLISPSQRAYRICSCICACI